MSDLTYGAFDALTKDNYKSWRIHAEALLVVSDLWDYVEKDKELISKDVGKREFWMKQDKIAKSQLILHISSTLLPLVEDCTTSREVWLKLENVYGNKGKEHEDSVENSDTDDEDTIINDIEISVDEFLKTITDVPGKRIIETKKSLSTGFTDSLFSQLKKDSIKKLPDKTIIVNTVSDFIDVIGKLSELEMKKLNNELTNKLIDNLLVKFNINPHQNNNDETESEADAPQTPDNDTAGGEKKENNQVPSSLIATNDDAKEKRHLFHKDEIHRILGEHWESCSQKEPENSTSLWAGIPYTPPSTPAPKVTRKCGVCRKEGHNRTTCPSNKPIASASKHTARTPEISKMPSSRSTATNPETPKRSYKCGICDEEGHNRTTCPLNKSVASASKNTATTPGISKISSPKSTATNTETPKRSYKCGGCGNEGHNITSCPERNSGISWGKPDIRSAPARSYKCGLCGEEGHNRTTCPRNYVTPKAPTRAAYRCSTCGGEGHNSRTCGRRETSSSSYYAAPSYSYSSPAPSYAYSSPAPSSGGGRSYTCGKCGGSGHNRRTCSG